MARIRKQEKIDIANTVNQIRWLIAIYIRLSREDGNDESLSITEQRKMLMEYIESNFNDGYTVVDVYCDDGLTGTDDTRDNFQRMINDVYDGKVNCIICKTLSRAFRNYADQGRYLEEIFPKYGVRFISEGNPHVDSYIHSDAIQNGLEIPINGLMNDRFAAKTSADIRRTFKAKRSRGEFIGAFAPYGYQKDPENKNDLIIDEEAAAVVRDIFDWYVFGDGLTEGGLSKEGIAKKLNEMGIHNPALYKKKKGLRYSNPQAANNDGLWMGTSITRTLKNKMYIGTMVQGKQRIISYKIHDAIQVPEEEWFQVENTHEPIISREVFEMAEEIQLRDTRAAPNKRETYLFSGFLKCADCGKAMTRRASKGIVYYNCSTYKRKSKDKCTIHTMRLDTLESAVLENVQHQIEIAEGLTELIENINQAPVVQTKSARLEHLLKLREQELEKTEAITTDLYADWKTGEITQEQYRKMKIKFTTQEEQLREAIAHIEDDIQTLRHGVDVQDPFFQAFKKHKNITELSQTVLTELINCIYVHENGELTIVFTLEDQYKRIVDFVENNKYTLEILGNKVG